MTAPLFLVAPGTLAGVAVGEVVAVEGAEARHAVAVVRMRVGESLYVGDGAGVRVLGEVVRTDPRRLDVRVTEVANAPAYRHEFVLVQALAKGDRDEQAVEMATELGVDIVIPWQAERCVSQWRAEKAIRGRAKWESVVASATKQSRRWWTPQVRPLATTDEVCRVIASADLTLVLHEDASDGLTSRPMPEAGRIIVVVGPEGGISGGEVTRLTAAGGTPVRLGMEVLRTSSAGPAALAVLASRLRWGAGPVGPSLG
ncbi:MAG: 16S rRNA (uracil(1498)-N(3))-methyltransferase [Dermatophilaceae bacterium]